MAARYKRHHLELSREKIKTSQLVNRLQDNAMAAQSFLDQHQIRCIEILLRKSMPDLASVEHTGDVTSFVMRLPEPAQDTASWERTNSVAPTLPHKGDKPVTH
jgi:hypothetical protein